MSWLTNFLFSCMLPIFVKLELSTDMNTIAVCGSLMGKGHHPSFGCESKGRYGSFR